MTVHLRSLLIGTALSLCLAGGALAQTVLHRGNNADPESLDPHKTSTVSEANILRDLFMGLTMHDAKASLIPGAAESWSVSEDGTVYTFKLRPGALWSDGSPVTASDFVYGWQRVVNPETAAEYAYMLSPIANAEAITAGEAAPDTLGVRAIDDLTLEVTLNATTPYFLEMLTHQATYPVQRANVEAFGADFAKPGNLVSNGAYTLASFVPNDRITLVKNPNFYDAANVAIDEVNFYPTEDRSTAIKRFEAGELDMNDDLPSEQLADIKAKFGDQVKIGPYLGTYYYLFKIPSEPWTDAQLRRAISMAIDRDFLAEKVWQGTMLPAYSFVPPGIEGYEAAAADYAEMSQIDREDAAIAILAELGYGPENPLPMEIRFNTSENHTNTAVAIQEQLKPLGIEVTMINTDAPTHWSFLEQHGDFDVARAGWIADYKDPENFLALCKSEAGNNYSEYANPAYDALLAQAAASADPAARMELLSQAEALGVAQDHCVVPLMFYSYRAVVSDKVRGWEPNVMDIHPTRFLSK
jgi:oligopeptide transport system substrate-binding protein